MLRHFSHRHPLSPFEVEEEEEEGFVCSGCELDLSGSAYKCNVRSSTCDFHLHKSCFELQRKIQHASHPQHRLTLLPSPPSRWGVFTCSACDGSGRGFTYHCKACDFDLHVQCSSLPEAVTRHDHQHPLALVFSLMPEVEEEEEDEHDDVGCGVCRTSLKEECWAYSCKDCDYVIHLDCVIDEACDDEVAEEQEEDEESQQVEDDHEDQSQEEEEEEDEEEEDEEEEEEEEEEKVDEEAEQKEDEETEDEEAEDDGEETEEDSDSIIAGNIRRIAAVQLVINNQNARRMRMQQEMMLNNTRRLFQFGL